MNEKARESMDDYYLVVKVYDRYIIMYVFIS